MGIWQCLIANKEVINMSLQAIVALAGCLVVVSLFFHRKAVLLQKDSIQATMFSEISGRISTILGEITQQGSDFFNWHIRLFNELEALLFLSNNNLLSESMKLYYRDFIIELVKELPQKYPDVANELENLSSQTFKLLREYYEKETGDTMLS